MVSIGPIATAHSTCPINKDNLGPGRITEIIALPGYEGALPRPNGMVAIFGLGFETLKPISVAERLETQSMLGFIAAPGAFPDYADLALHQNRDFIEHYLKETPLRFPIRQPTKLYRALSEIVTPYIDRNFNVHIVPLGPKPHVLAALLVATKCSELTVLQVSSALTQPEIVNALKDDPFVMTRINFSEAMAA
jgi:hypothetical protein